MFAEGDLQIKEETIRWLILLTILLQQYRQEPVDIKLPARVSRGRPVIAQ